MAPRAVGYRARAPHGVVAAPLQPTQAQAIDAALCILKLAQDRSDDVEAAEDWVARLDETQRAAAWQAACAAGWTIREVYR